MPNPRRSICDEPETATATDPHESRPRSPGPSTGFDPWERRVAPRSIALEFRSWLGWWEGPNFVAESARLLDISRAGVAVEAEGRPPDGREVWFCLHPAGDRDGVGGEVVGVGRGSRGRHLIRVAFWEPCPDALFRRALHGFLDDDERPHPAAED